MNKLFYIIIATICTNYCYGGFFDFVVPPKIKTLSDMIHADTLVEFQKMLDTNKLKFFNKITDVGVVTTFIDNMRNNSVVYFIMLCLLLFLNLVLVALTVFNLWSKYKDKFLYYESGRTSSEEVNSV